MRQRSIRVESNRNARHLRRARLGWSQFDLEKQVEIQQDYIAKLQAQIGDIKHDMSSQ